MRRLAAIGIGLSAGMQFIFFATGFDRDGLYLALQVLGMLATAYAAWGVLALPGTAGAVGIAVGMGGNALVRLLHVALGLTRLPGYVNWPLFAGYVLVCIGAALWAARPKDERLAWARAGCWIVAFAYFVATVTATGSGRLLAMLALLLGCVGFSLAAPNLHAGAKE